MKLKRYFIASGIVGAVGLVVAFIALLTVGFDIERMDLEMDYTEKTYTIGSAEVSAVSMITEDMKITVRYRDDDSDEIKITYYENDKHKPTVKNENGTLTFYDKTNTSTKIINGIFGLEGIFNGFKRSRLTTVVELPKDSKSLKLSLATSNGAVKADGIDADSLELVTSNGEITVGGNITGKVYCKTSNSSITANDISADSAELVTSNGMVTVSGEIVGDIYCMTSNAQINSEKLTAQKAEFKTSNNSCDLGNIQCESLEVCTSNSFISCLEVNADKVYFKTSNGGINADDVSASASFYAQTSNAGIDIKSVESDNIELYSSNGGINATVVGSEKDYAIESGTSNGNNNLYGRGDATKEKSLRVNTSNADINVLFTQ